ncbi:uncharacterized protein LDX57_004988 [Aspergillus melleus]|uniref:uncharacterized protein n=1 Tax=Aspergillus melleus TaxID=138277 RepID=UPI001E8D9712|nr:uncharacterized protein LDX57_004988 [Aspergillus melleus]KAH8427274.1 hypothetical protein LDX57_004988 [Aspergillus melleus]
MKFSFASLLVAGTTVASAANAASVGNAGSAGSTGLPSIPQSCLEIPQVVGNKPQQLMQYFHKEVCQQGCKATINQHNHYLHNYVMPQIIKDVNQRLEVPVQEQQLFNQTSTQVVAAVQKSCAQEGNKPLCNDLQGVFDYGLCAFKASQPILMNHVKEFSGSAKLTEEKCNKIKALDSDQTIWQKTLPAYVDKFAKQCAQGN